ncbi:hypothetical protein KFK09_025441 [Dendrobium nobile]|uniref:Uncharacterized protein n=1 Tax=Dendrobium nobile TaxID=94219 RepID=A0A8T3AGZ0_DENNO|nr:hypothetical protein KFK09_025441 [Dendrobium nobile]
MLDKPIYVCLNSRVKTRGLLEFGSTGCCSEIAFLLQISFQKRFIEKFNHALHNFPEKEKSRHYSCFPHQ